MTPDVARDALIFLGRVDLKGAEAPRLMQVLAAIETIARMEVTEPASERND